MLDKDAEIDMNFDKIIQLFQNLFTPISDDRQNPDNRIHLIQNDDRYTADSRRTGDSPYESTKRTAVIICVQLVYSSETDRRNSQF